MGNIRPKHIKYICYELMETYPDRVTTDFELNKQLLMDVTDVESKLLRNRIAGYLVREKKKSGKLIFPPKTGKKINKPKKKRGAFDDNSRF